MSGLGTPDSDTVTDGLILHENWRVASVPEAHPKRLQRETLYP